MSELLAIAVDQRAKLKDATREILDRPAKIWTSEYRGSAADNSETVVVKRWLTAEMEDRMIVFSRACQKLLESAGARYLRFVAPLVAYFVLAWEAETEQFLYSRHTTADVVIYILDLIVNVVFLIQSVITLLGAPIRYRIEQAFNRDVDVVTLCVDSGVLGMIMAVFCLAYPLASMEGLWLRLFRLALMATSILEFLPHIEMLVVPRLS